VKEERGIETPLPEREIRAEHFWSRLVEEEARKKNKTEEEEIVSLEVRRVRNIKPTTCWRERGERKASEKSSQ